jgi:uncharacterized protein YqgV (UPF0045/DUF77 family)
VIVDIEVVPQPLGTEGDKYAHVEAAIALAQASGLHYEVNALGTTIEGAPDVVGAEFVITVCKIAEHRAASENPTIDGLTRKFRT